MAVTIIILPKLIFDSYSTTVGYAHERMVKDMNLVLFCSLYCKKQIYIYMYLVVTVNESHAPKVSLWYTSIAVVMNSVILTTQEVTIASGVSVNEDIR